MIAARALDFDSWRLQARGLLQAQIPPENVIWGDQQAALFSAELAPSREAPAETVRVPASFLRKAEVACEHADPDRFAVLYRLLWKLAHGLVHTLDDPLDPDAAKLTAMLRQIREEEHDMHAFVRFRRTLAPDGSEHWVAWFNPVHAILRRVAPFFARRYPAMHWTLLTPTASAAWDGTELHFGPGAPSEAAPRQDQIDALFLSYYEKIFNPARSNPKLLNSHLPPRLLRQMPEGGEVARLLEEAPQRVQKMNAPRASASATLLPSERGVGSLRDAAAHCRACPIGEHATQTVFGEGPTTARLMIVGEQPGDEEDLAGRPFVGPAGRLLEQFLARAGLSRSEIYVTNAVKHFKFERLPTKRRLHMRPVRSEVEACRAWLLAEVEAIKPEMILCLGATAAQSFCGPQFRVQRDRGKPTSTPWAPWWMATYHPSALLRAPDEAARQEMERQFVADLATTREQLATLLQPLDETS